MENLKKERPCAVCMRCGKVWYRDDCPPVRSLHQCDPAKPDKGAISLREAPDRWMDCWSCSGSGTYEGGSCPACKGVGYHPTAR